MKAIKPVLIFLFMMGAWILDVSITTLNLNGVLTNGIIILDPVIGYHIGLGLMLLTFMISQFILDNRK